MNKKILYAAAAALLSLSTVGCSLATPDPDDWQGETLFVGLMITLYARDERETPLNSTVFGEESCVAEFLECTLGGTDGAPYFQSGSSGEAYLFSNDILHDSDETDGKNACSFSSSVTVYCDPSYADRMFFSVDTLSRNGAGEIERQEGMHVGMESTAITHTVKAEHALDYTRTEDGKRKRATVTLSVELTFEYREAGTDWAILQYTEGGELLARTAVTEADAGAFPLREDCAYVIAEERTSEGVRRAVYGREDCAEFYSDGGFGLLKRTEFSFSDREETI